MDRGAPSDTAIAELLDAANRVAAAAFPRLAEAAAQPGLYAWFVDVEGATQLSMALGLPVGSGLIYAGQAGAGTSTATLRSRVRGNHLGGTITGSTFRLTLASLLAKDLGLVDAGGRRLAAEGETRLTGWMIEHLALAITPSPNRAALSHLEDDVLAKLNPPLNLQGMAPSAVRNALRESRRRPLGRMNR